MSFPLLVSILLSVAATAFWLFFYYHYSPRFTTPRLTLAGLLLAGALAAGAVFFAEREVFSHFSPTLSSLLLQGTPVSENLGNVFMVAGVMFFVVAPLEESVKFFLLRVSMRMRPNEWNQIIDGIKFGLVAGLGFAAMENAIYFYTAFPAQGSSREGVIAFFQTVFLRFFTATLAHSLYSGMMGYFLGLARFYRLYADRFEKRAFFFPIILHGLYNTFLFTSANFYSILLIIIFLFLLLKWYSDRRNLEIRIERGEAEIILPPFLSDRPEFESILAKNQVSYQFIKELRLCPFCLRQDTLKDNMCSACGRKLERG